MSDGTGPHSEGNGTFETRPTHGRSGRGVIVVSTVAVLAAATALGSWYWHTKAQSVRGSIILSCPTI